MKINEESPNQSGSEREYSSSEKFRAAMSQIKKEMNGQGNRRMLLINKLQYRGLFSLQLSDHCEEYTGKTATATDRTGTLCIGSNYQRIH